MSIERDEQQFFERVSSSSMLKVSLCQRPKIRMPQDQPNPQGIVCEITHIRTCSNTCYVHCSTMYNGHHKKVIFQILQASLHIILRHEERNFYGKKSFRPPFIVTRSVLIKVFCKKCQITQLFLKNLKAFFVD